MLKKFTVQNYRGFATPLVWDLAHPGNYEYNSHAIKNGIVKNGIVFGKNGTGKSNLALAIFDIVNHLTQKEKNTNYYQNFLSADTSEETVRFEYVFQYKEQEITYAYTKDRNGALKSEQLRIGEREVLMQENEMLKIDDEFRLDDAVKRQLSESHNRTSLINFLHASMPLPVGHYLLFLKDFVDRMLWFKNLETRDYIGLETGRTNIIEFIIQKNLLADFSAFLTQVSEQQFHFLTPKAEDDDLLCQFGNRTLPFNQIFSTGTSALTLLYFWMQKMGETSFVFIDEFDAFYHFKLAYEVCQRLFRLPDTQLFLSSHDTSLMDNDLLRPDCYFVIDGQQIQPLNKLTQKELRWGHNLEKLYRGNTFSS